MLPLLLVSNTISFMDSNTPLPLVPNYTSYVTFTRSFNSFYLDYFSYRPLISMIHYSLHSFNIFYLHSLHVIYSLFEQNILFLWAPSCVCFWIERYLPWCQTLNSLFFRPYNIVVHASAIPHISSCQFSSWVQISSFFGVKPHNHLI